MAITYTTTSTCPRPQNNRLLWCLDLLSLLIQGAAFLQIITLFFLLHPMFIIFCYNDDGNTFYYYVCITYLFHFFSCDLSFFSVAIVSFFLLTFVSLYALFLSLYSYVRREACFRRLLAYLSLWLRNYWCYIFCCFERSFRIASMVRFFYISVFIILLS